MHDRKSPHLPTARIRDWLVFMDRRPRVEWMCLLRQPSVPIDQHAVIVRAIASSSLSPESTAPVPVASVVSGLHVA